MSNPQKYRELSREIPITYNVDVLVAGGGVAGICAALAAARAGARTLLVERNGILGGVATAGLETAFGGFFYDGLGENVVSGIPKEFVQRIIDKGGAHRNSLLTDERKRPSKIYFDPEVFKLCAIEMLQSSGVKILLHTMVVDAIKTGNALKGVVVENKSGRQAIMARTVVDATGEMDVAHLSNAPYRVKNLRSACNTIMWRVGGVDWEKLRGFFKRHDHELWKKFNESWEQGYVRVDCWSIFRLGSWRPFEGIIREAIAQGVFREEHFNWGRGKGGDLSKRPSKKDPLKSEWCFDTQGIEGLPGSDICGIWGTCTLTVLGTDAQRVSDFECFGTQMIWKFFEHVIKKFPGFEKSYILAIAPDLGVRTARQIATRYKITPGDLYEGRRYKDVIGRGTLHTSAVKYRKSREKGNILVDATGHVPVRGYDIRYRMLLPRKIENLLLAGKAFGMIRGMATCMVTGQAAGAAAALASQKGVWPSRLNIHELQHLLEEQEVNLGKG